MLRTSLLSGLAALCCVSTARAQVDVRAPFVRVQTGGPGVWVRAPFVNIFVPSRPVYGPPIYGPPLVQPAPVIVPALPAPVPPPAGVEVPQAPLPNRVMSVEEFGKTFQAKAGAYQLVLLNPLSGEPNTVQFSLPDGTPRRVNVHRTGIDFVYGPRQFVRIEFDRDGPIVTTR